VITLAGVWILNFSVDLVKQAHSLPSRSPTWSNEAFNVFLSDKCYEETRAGRTGMPSFYFFFLFNLVFLGRNIWVSFSYFVVALALPFLFSEVFGFLGSSPEENMGASFLQCS